MFRYEKNRGNEHVVKTAEFRSAKKIEEEALMAALGLQIIPPTSTTQSRPVIKREPQSTSVKNEPMTPAVHHDSRKSKNDKHRREDRRRQRQMKTAASDEEKNNWSENDDEEDLMDEAYDNDESKRSLQQNMSTEKELDEFLLDLIDKHGLKTIKHALKSKKFVVNLEIMFIFCSFAERKLINHHHRNPKMKDKNHIKNINIKANILIGKIQNPVNDIEVGPHRHHVIVLNVVMIDRFNPNIFLFFLYNSKFCSIDY